MVLSASSFLWQSQARPPLENIVKIVDLYKVDTVSNGNTHVNLPPGSRLSVCVDFSLPLL